MWFGSLTEFFSESKISYLAYISWLFWYLFKKYVLTFKITMNNVFLVYSSESSQNLGKNIDCFCQFEHPIRHTILIAIEVAVLAVLHDQKYRFSLYMTIEVPTNVFRSLTMLWCLRPYMRFIYWLRYFYKEGRLMSCFLDMHLTARGRNYCPIELPR